MEEKMEKQYFKRTRIPKRLEDCKIVNSFINISLSSKYRTSYISEMLVQSLNSQGVSLVKIQIDPNETKSLKPQFMYVNTDYKIRFFNDSISINCNRKYVGWDNYTIFITLILNELVIIDDEITFPFIGLNYISAYEDIDILAKLDGNFELENIPPFANRSFEIPCEYQNDKLGKRSAQVFCKIQDRVPGSGSKKISFISVAVNHQKDGRNMETVVNDFEILHKIEKEVFFNLISEEFINEQKPIYE